MEPAEEAVVSTRWAAGARESGPPLMSDTYDVPPTTTSPAATSATVGPSDIPRGPPPPSVRFHPVSRQLCDRPRRTYSAGVARPPHRRDCVFEISPYPLVPVLNLPARPAHPASRAAHRSWARP